MRKATFFMSTISAIASVTTLGLLLMTAKKLHDEIEDLRAKTNERLNKFKQAFTNFEI